jgi:Na+-transporting NADH:ubiquinone oxidoreductase subunit NqrC
VDTSEEKLTQAFRKQLLLVAGFKQDEVDKMGLSEINDEEFQDIVRKRLLDTSTDDCTKQKVVDIGEVESYLAKGWEYVANLPNKRVIIKLSA